MTYSGAALFLMIGVIAVGILFIRGVTAAARLEFENAPVAVRKYQTRALVLFASIVVIDQGLGRSGVLLKFDHLPPPFFGFLIFNLALVFGISFSRMGDLLVRHTPYSALIGFQAFRILAEILLVVAFHEGLAPQQMTLEGYNFDIVTGVSALALGLFLRKRNLNRNLIIAWNCMGLSFLAIVLFIALTSLPTPLRLFMNEPSNIWVAIAPYTMLPGVLVVAALTGHVLVFRKLRFTP